MVAMETTIKGRGQPVTIGYDRPTAIIGERINPTGKKRLAAALVAGDLETVCREAREQVEAGAAILDVNVGAAGVDEVALLPRAVEAVVETVSVPLCIDSANESALRAALARFHELVPDGRALVNSVNGEEKRLKVVLPLVAEFGAAVIGLAMDDGGIPVTAEGRLAIAERIVERAARLGIARENVLIDCLALTMGADTIAGRTTLDAIQLVHDRLGLNQSLGASNVSFGLPERGLINNAWLPMVLLAGVTAPIVDAAQVRMSILAADMALGRDQNCMTYIRAYRKWSKARAQ
jgi:5-methyltetrahydrofolate--homocysteine methyltransferase